MDYSVLCDLLLGLCWGAHLRVRRDKFDAILWMLFSLGGFIIAFMLPVHILVNNLAPFFGIVSGELVSYEQLTSRLASPLVKLYLIVILVAALYHGMHRFKFVLYDWGLKDFSKEVAIAAYAVGALGSIVGIYYILAISPLAIPLP